MFAILYPFASKMLNVILKITIKLKHENYYSQKVPILQLLFIFFIKYCAHILFAYHKIRLHFTTRFLILCKE